MRFADLATPGVVTYVKEQIDGYRQNMTVVPNYLSIKQLTPGRSLPSRNSRDAPPPVEM